MKEPDYEAYSLNELLDARRNIDRKRFPERRSRLEAEIAKRRSASPGAEAPTSGAAFSPEPTTHTSWTQALAALVIVAVLTAAGVGVWAASFFWSPEVQKLRASLDSVAAAVERAFPDQAFALSIRGKLDEARRDLKITVVNSSWLELPERDRERKAQHVAAVARRGFPRPSDVGRIEVRYEERSELGPLKTARVGSHYVFDASDRLMPRE